MASTNVGQRSSSYPQISSENWAIRDEIAGLALAPPTLALRWVDTIDPVDAGQAGSDEL
jgi:hypothetical protein